MLVNIQCIYCLITIFPLSLLFCSAYFGTAYSTGPPRFILCTCTSSNLVASIPLIWTQKEKSLKVALCVSSARASLLFLSFSHSFFPPLFPSTPSTLLNGFPTQPIFFLHPHILFYSKFKSKLFLKNFCNSYLFWTFFGRRQYARDFFFRRITF